MAYKMVFHTDNNAVGHFSVEIRNGDEAIVKGFYPEKDFATKSTTAKPVPGKILDDLKRIQEGETNGSTRASKEIDLTQEQYDRVRAYMDKADKTPGSYDLNDRNCVDFANGALRAAGIGKDLGNVLTDEQKSQMSGAAVYQGRKFPEHDDLKFDMPPKPQPNNKPEPETQPFPVPLPPKPQPPETPASTPEPPKPEPAPEPQPQPPQPAPAPAPQPQPTPPPEQKQSEAPADPKLASLVAMARAPVDNPGQSALLKPVDKLTQSEMMDMIHSAQGDYRGWRSGDPLKAHTYEKVQDWHVNVYGDGPQRNDGGKPIEPMPIRPIPEQPSPHTTPDGEDLWQATGRIGDTVAEAARSEGTDNAVKGLQRGLNMLNGANPLPDRSPAYGPYTKLAPVDEDGQYGPQTDFALKHATARFGAPKVEEALALGRFNTFARNAQNSGNVDRLEAVTHRALGPLFRDPTDSTTPKMEAGVFLNGIGSRNHDAWQDLTVDNWIGPKTTPAFGKILEGEDADTLTTAFGRGLGFL